MKIPEFIPDVVLELRKDGTALDGKQVEVAALQKLLKDLAAAGKQRLKVVADESTSFRHVQRILDIARKAGLLEIAFTSRR